MYRYKGLNIKLDPQSKAKEKTIFVRIGALEAEFKIDSCEKNSGALSPDEERLGLGLDLELAVLLQFRKLGSILGLLAAPPSALSGRTWVLAGTRSGA